MSSHETEEGTYLYKEACPDCGSSDACAVFSDSKIGLNWEECH